MSVSTKTKRKPRSSSDHTTPSCKRWKYSTVLISDDEDAAAPSDQSRLSHFTERQCVDCGFVGLVEYFRGAKSSALSPRCVQCRALETALARYRATWGPTADFNHQAHVELVVEQLEKWAAKHQPFPAGVDYRVAVAEIAESKVRAWGKRPSSNNAPMSSFQQSFYTSKKRTRSSASAVRRLDSSADDASPLDKGRQRKAFRESSLRGATQGLHNRSYSRAASIPDSEPPNRMRDWFKQSQESIATDRQANRVLMAQLFPEDNPTRESSTASPAASIVTDVSHAESAYNDQAIGVDQSSQPSKPSHQASPDSLKDVDNLDSLTQQGTDADDPQFFTNAAQFLHTIADGLDRLSREPVQQRRYFARLLGLDTL